MNIKYFLKKTKSSVCLFFIYKFHFYVAIKLLIIFLHLYFLIQNKQYDLRVKYKQF